MNDFVFLANWYDIIKAYDDAGQPEMASSIAKEIIIYGVTGNTKTTDPLIYGIIRGLCADQIKRPKVRSARSVKNENKCGRPQKYDKDQMLKLRNDGLSDQDIADNLRCSVKTVQRALASADDDDEI